MSNDTQITTTKAIRAVNRAQALAAVVKPIRLVPDLTTEDFDALGGYVHERMVVFAAMSSRWDFSQKVAYAEDTVRGVLARARVTR